MAIKYLGIIETGVLSRAPEVVIEIGKRRRFEDDEACQAFRELAPSAFVDLVEMFPFSRAIALEFREGGIFADLAGANYKQAQGLLLKRFPPSDYPNVEKWLLAVKRALEEKPKGRKK